MKISSVYAREILDSRGNPTVEVEVKTDGGGFGRGAAPSGASTGSFEAVELRDTMDKRYLGKGVQTAVENVNKKIAKAIIGGAGKGKKKSGPKKTKTSESETPGSLNPLEIDKLMLELDGTPNKANLGANAIVATSMAIIKAIADEQEKPLYQYIAELSGTTPKLPQPMFNIINGGKHAGNGLAVQEFMIMPKGKTFSETLRMASEIYHVLGKILVEKYGPAAKNVGDEGGYAPPIGKTEEALDAIMSAIEKAGYASETKIAMDCAASSFYESVMKTYHIDGLGVSRDTLLKYYGDFLKKYPIASIEDPFDENDFDGFASLLENINEGGIGKTNGKIMIVGDDLLVTNPERIKQGIEHNSCNALLLKVNQIGSVSESLNAAEMCRKAGWNIVVSHRSGETEDTFIADFAVGIGSEYLKTGAPARGERTCKYNQLLRIEEGMD